MGDLFVVLLDIVLAPNSECGVMQLSGLVAHLVRYITLLQVQIGLFKIIIVNQRCEDGFLEEFRRL